MIQIEKKSEPITGKKYKVTLVGWTTIIKAAAYALEGVGVSFYRIWPGVPYDPVTFRGMEKFLSYLDCKSVEVIDD